MAARAASPNRIPLNVLLATSALGLLRNCTISFAAVVKSCIFKLVVDRFNNGVFDTWRRSAGFVINGFQFLTLPPADPTFKDPEDVEGEIGIKFSLLEEIGIKFSLLAARNASDSASGKSRAAATGGLAAAMAGDRLPFILGPFILGGT